MFVTVASQNKVASHIHSQFVRSDGFTGNADPTVGCMPDIWNKLVHLNRTPVLHFCTVQFDSILMSCRQHCELTKFRLRLQRAYKCKYTQWFQCKLSNDSSADAVSLAHIFDDTLISMFTTLYQKQEIPLEMDRKIWNIQVEHIDSVILATAIIDMSEWALMSSNHELVQRSMDLNNCNRGGISECSISLRFQLKRVHTDQGLSNEYLTKMNGLTSRSSEKMTNDKITDVNQVECPDRTFQDKSEAALNMVVSSNREFRTSSDLKENVGRYQVNPCQDAVGNEELEHYTASERDFMLANSISQVDTSQAEIRWQNLSLLDWCNDTIDQSLSNTYASLEQLKNDKRGVYYLIKNLTSDIQTLPDWDQENEPCRKELLLEYALKIIGLSSSVTSSFIESPDFALEEFTESLRKLKARVETAGLAGHRAQCPMKGYMSKSLIMMKSKRRRFKESRKTSTSHDEQAVSKHKRRMIESKSFRDLVQCISISYGWNWMSKSILNSLGCTPAKLRSIAQDGSKEMNLKIEQANDSQKTSDSGIVSGNELANISINNGFLDKREKEDKTDKKNNWPTPSNGIYDPDAILADCMEVADTIQLVIESCPSLESLTDVLDAERELDRVRNEQEELDCAAVFARARLHDVARSGKRKNTMQCMQAWVDIVNKRDLSFHRFNEVAIRKEQLELESKQKDIVDKLRSMADLHGYVDEKDRRRLENEIIQIVDARNKLVQQMDLENFYKSETEHITTAVRNKKIPKYNKINQCHVQ